jgi:hypothetical protein
LTIAPPQTRIAITHDQIKGNDCDISLAKIAIFILLSNKKIQYFIEGDLSRIFRWLHDKTWSKCSVLTTNELVSSATGDTLNPEHFKAQLKSRYL